MTPMPSATASLTELLPAPGPGTPLLSYPLATSEACVLTSDPATWAQRTAWDIREHNLGRFLDARHGAKIEDYWTPEFIKYRGRTYCELVLKYIIMFNHEEVGGHAVMFIDQMMMWQPHYFPYAMKYRCYVDAIFEKDQIEHYGRKFLEKVVEWCKIAYEKSQLYWDHLLADPPTDEYFEVFVTLVRKQHTPQKLKAMNIVPKEREDDWPCNYFARARGKTPLPQLQMQKEAAKQHCNLGSPGNNSGKTNASTQPKDTNGGSRGDAKSSPHGATPTASSTGNQVTSGAGKGKQASVALLAAGGGGGDDDSDDSDSEDKKCDPRDSTPPKSPKGKKSVSSEAEDNSLRVHDSVVHRRVKSESDSQVKKVGLSLADWMTAPGMVRRAVSAETQSKLLEKAVNGSEKGSSQVPITGRGGIEAALGRYQYRPNAAAPTFAHPYSWDTVIQNNAAYLYHQDHSFGRSYPPLPDHATTYRPSSNSYRTDPHHGEMFLQVAQPQPHFSYNQMQAGGYNQMQAGGYNQMQAGGYNQMPAYHQQQGLNQMPSSAYGAQSPHINQIGQPHSVVPSPHIVQTAPHSVVPNHIMEPYIQMAAAGQWPQSQPPLSRVSHPSTYPGYPPMRHPPQFIARALPQQVFVPHQPQDLIPPSPRPCVEQQINAVRTGAPLATPYMGTRNVRRDMAHSKPAHFSPRASSFGPGRYRPTPQGQASMPSRGPATATSVHVNRPHRVSAASRTPRHASSSGETLPFPSYMDDMADPAGLPESQQCTSDTIGPDAEDVVTLWFADIPPGSTAGQLKALIVDKMPVADIRSPITFDVKQNYDRGWTFVKFLSNTDARTALDFFQGHSFNGGHLKVQVPDRRTVAGTYRPRTRTSLRNFGQGQSSDNADGFASHQASFGGDSTLGRYQGFGAPPGPRHSRGNSMTQAIHAVRRNNAFTKQDARSDLLLPDLPEITEPSKPPTPEQPESAEDEHLQAVEKPGKKSKKKRKPAKSRDASVAPSESNISSVAEASGVSHASTNIIPLRTTISETIQYYMTYAAVAVSDSPFDPVPQVSDDVGAGEVDSSPQENPPAAAELENATSEDMTENALGGSSAPAVTEIAVAGHADTSGSDSGKTEAKAEPSSSDPSTSLDQAAMGDEEIDTVSSVTGMSDVKSEATTVAHKQPVAAPSKPSKTKGPAQTESLSAFVSMSKHHKKIEKTKAKKARQASRKVSKTSTGAVDTGKTRGDEGKLPDDGVGAETSLSGDTKGKGKGKVGSKGKQGQYGVSESSSLAGTPDTARVYPASIPNTPTRKLSTFAADALGVQTPGKLLGEGEMEEFTSPGGTATTRRRSSVMGGMLKPASTYSDPRKPIDSFVQQSHHPSQPSGDGSSLPKKTTSNPVKTYAQATKGTKTGTTTTTNTTLGLSERDVNVQR